MYMQIIKITTLGLYVLEGLEEKIIVNTENEIIVIIIIIIIIYTLIDWFWASLKMLNLMRLGLYIMVISWPCHITF